jgi:dye decolorizing peroxidase
VTQPPGSAEETGRASSAGRLPRTVSRRALFGTGGLLAASLGAGGIAAGLSGADSKVSADVDSDAVPAGFESVGFHGDHQAGITTEPVQAHVRFVALDLKPGTRLDDVRRLMRLLSDDAARMSAGQPPLAAEDPQLPRLPSRLTVTFGFGAGLFDAIGRGAECPEVIRRLPAFSTDRLQPRWCGGDVLIQVCSDDAVPLSYAVRRLVRDARDLATVRWSQAGFNRARGSERVGTTPRNLFSQRDGTANPPAESSELAQAVWSQGEPEWMAGGSHLVLRRIRMDLDTWDDLGLFAKETSTARRLEDGAPVTGGKEHDKLDYTAVGSDGFPVVATEAHVARATPQAPSERMLRRGFSFDDGPTADGKPDAGLLFAAYQADAATAFVPVQRRLAETDAMNLWITHIGSAAFVVPPGCRPGEFIGHQLIG